ncbi:GntR family transcriptional regulator [Paenibacillus sp. 79R4]|nr:GntR family transcriptional regulator [Paenibacillus sp. GM2]NWL87656.1 GntR family transcriptional regulator [Paenibacillus sp. 79R4]
MSESTSSKPMYEQIFNDVKRRIIDNTYMAGDKIPSEKELAEAYNVSRITSKRALEMLAAENFIIRRPGRGSFVAEAGDDGQAPPAAAKSSAVLKKRPGKLIGVVLTDFANSYGTRLIYGMESAARELDCYLILRRTFGVQENEEETIRKLLELGVDGLIVFPAQGEYFNAEILKLVIERFPLVLIDREIKGVASSSISTDNVQAAFMATEYLFELGHSHISILSPPPKDTSAIEERIEGVMQAYASHGVIVDQRLWITGLTSTLPNSFNDEEKIEQDIERIMNHLQAFPEITALFAFEYHIALLVKEAARRLGLNIPSDISVICFDHPLFRLGEGYAFTHMRQQEENMGRLALEQVTALMGSGAGAGRTKLQAQLIPGESAASVRSHSMDRSSF